MIRQGGGRVCVRRRSIPDTQGSFPVLSSGVESFYCHYKNKTKPKVPLRAEEVAQYESP